LRIPKKEMNTIKSPQVTAHGKTSAIGPVKIGLVEDQPDARDNLSRLINSFPDLTCVCICKTGEEALRLIPEVEPDVVLMDIFLPRMSGIECTARLKAIMPKIKIVILTAMNDEELIFMALEGGADGYLLKCTESVELRTSLLDVLGGGAPMSSEIARRVVESFRIKAKNQNESVSLSLREKQILLLLCKGYRNKIIATKMDVKVDTVCQHLKHIYEKMHVRSRTEAVVAYLSSNQISQLK
jgi:DNA-binding NarL/FixJ family response regulator